MALRKELFPLKRRPVPRMPAVPAPDGLYSAAYGLIRRDSVRVLSTEDEVRSLLYLPKNAHASEVVSRQLDVAVGAGALIYLSFILSVL